MTDANSRQVALQNLREFQEMSYLDVYALIRQKRFDEAKSKYAAVLESMGCDHFSAAINLNITTPHDTLLDCMSKMASGVSEPEKIRAVGFDLSAHAIHHDENGYLSQGVEISLYGEDVYDFAGASDKQLRYQCESSASDWQGCFMEIDSISLDGLGPVAKQFQNHAKNQNNLQGIIESEDGAVIVDPVAIARHVAKLLVAVEYHRHMAEFVSEVEVPSQMVFIIGEHDEIEVPIVFYRVGEKTLAEPVTSLEEEPVQALPHEETPAMYHPAEPVDEVHEEKSASTHLGGALYEAAKQQLVQAHETKPAMVKLDKPIEVSSDSQATEEIVQEKPTTSANAMSGRPLEPKTFGQRNNKIFKDGSNE